LHINYTFLLKCIILLIFVVFFILLQKNFLHLVLQALIPWLVHLLNKDGPRSATLKSIKTLLTEEIEKSGAKSRHHTHILLGGKRREAVCGAQVPEENVRRLERLSPNPDASISILGLHGLVK